MTISSFEDMYRSARRLPTKYKESMLRMLEDREAQLQIWMEHPEKLTKDEGLHRGIVYLAGVLVEKEST